MGPGRLIALSKVVDCAKRSDPTTCDVFIGDTQGYQATESLMRAPFIRLRQNTLQLAAGSFILSDADMAAHLMQRE